MKNLQINTAPIGAQKYNLGEKVGEDIYIYREDPQVYLSSLSIFRNNGNVNDNLWFDSNDVEADQFFITDYWTDGNRSNSYRNGSASYDRDHVSKWEVGDTHTIRVRAYQVTPHFDNYYNLFSIYLGSDNKFHFGEFFEGIHQLTWEDNTPIGITKANISYTQGSDPNYDHQFTYLKIYLN